MIQEPVTTSAQPVKSRNPSIDIVKGIAITLVVLGHALGGMLERGWWTSPRAGLLYGFIYSFHMPAFFFTSGLLVGSSLNRLTPAAFLTGKGRVILYPYLLIVLIRWVLEPFLSGVTMTYRMVSPLHLLRQPLTGDPSWFLPCLFLCMVLTLLTKRVPDWLRVVVAVLICLVTPDRWPSTVVLAKEWPFMAVGQLVGAHIAVLSRLKRLYAAALLLLLLAFQLGAVTELQPAAAGSQVRSHGLFIVLGLSGITGLFCMARLLVDTPAARFAAWVGEASIAIYLLHPFFQGATRMAVVLLLHTHRPLPQLLLTTLVATLVPASLYHQRRRLRRGSRDWLFRRTAHLQWK